MQNRQHHNSFGHMQSWLFGKAIQLSEPDAVALHTSQGYESPHSKFLMRLTVIASDLLGESCHISKSAHIVVSMQPSSTLVCCAAVLFPAVFICLRVFAKARAPCEQQWWLAIVLLQPAALLVDHGHFQYNNISLGFAVSPSWRLSADTVHAPVAGACIAANTLPLPPASNACTCGCQEQCN